VNQKYKCLEFRPWPFSTNLKNKFREQDGGFECDDTFYFGIRVKNFGELTIEER
jgi:hypothetical protein